MSKNSYKFSETSLFSKAPLFSVLDNVGDPHNLYPNSEALFARFETAKNNYENEKKNIQASSLDQDRFHENLAKLSAEIAMLEEVLKFLDFDLEK